jgi:hypothetical protein
MERKGLTRVHTGNTRREDLRVAVFKAIDPYAIEVVSKDMRWVEGALLADKTVASQDDTVRNHFHRAAQQVGELRAIVWVNPSTEEENGRIWLREGAPAEPHRMLGYREE